MEAGGEPTFAERLRSWLTFLGMKQATLARACDVSPAAVHGWLSGAALTTDRIGPICAALKVSQAEFFARMPSLEATDDLPEEKLPPHPRTRSITRELKVVSLEGPTCPTCGSAASSGEAA